MPKTADFEALTGARQRVYRAIFNLYIERKASPSLAEIAGAARMKVPNVHSTVVWLEHEEWLSRRPKEHRSIVPLVRLPRKQPRKSA